MINKGNKMKIQFIKLPYGYQAGATDCPVTYRTIRKVKRGVVGLDYGYCENDGTGGWRVGYCDEFTKSREWAWQVDSKAAAVNMIKINMGGV